MSITRVRWTAVVCAAALLGGVGYVRAQVQQAPAADAPSLAAIASELRLLRQAVEKSTDTQTQIQALTAALSAQQSRLMQVSARAEALRKDVDTAVSGHAQVADYVARLSAQLASGQLSAEARDQASLELKAAREEEQKAAGKETQVRTAIAEADAAVQTELSRWTELMTRLDQLARR
jgi:chromosome segregation ATPase